MAVTNDQATVVLDRLVSHLRDHHPDVLDAFISEGLNPRRGPVGTVPVGEWIDKTEDLILVIQAWT